LIPLKAWLKSLKIGYKMEHTGIGGNIILWSIDPLLGKDLDTYNEYNRYYKIGV
jgi:hypothetical protein